MLPKPINGLLAVQVCAPIVGDRHDRRRERVGVKRQDPAPRGKHERMNPRHPAQPLIKLVAPDRLPSSRLSRDRLRDRLLSPALKLAIACSISVGEIPWGDVQHPRPRPLDRRLRAELVVRSGQTSGAPLPSGGRGWSARTARATDRARRRAPDCSRDSPACRPSGTSGPTGFPLAASHAPSITTSSAFRSPLPAYHAASRLPSFVWTTHEA